MRVDEHLHFAVFDDVGNLSVNVASVGDARTLYELWRELIAARMPSRREMDIGAHMATSPRATLPPG